MCFTMAWLAQLCILVIVAIATYVILINILLPYILKKLGGGEVAEGAGVVIAVVRVILWAIVAIMVIYIVVALLACLWGFVGGVSLLPHR